MKRALLWLSLCAAIACGREDVELIDGEVDAAPGDAGEIVIPIAAHEDCEPCLVEEICFDGVDNDCNGDVDDGCVDVD